MKKPQVVLVNWSIKGDINPYRAPEQFGPRLAGEVVGHPNHDDGHYVTTSPLVWNGSLEGDTAIRDQMIVETANTLYLLEGVDPKYKAWCDANSYEVMS